MKKIMLFLTFLMVPFWAFSQWRKVEKLQKDTCFGIKLSYYGNTDYTGIMLGAERMMRHRKVTIGKFVRTKASFLTLNVAFLEVANLNNNLSLHAEWLKRTYYQNSGFFTELAAGFGVGTGINVGEPDLYVRQPSGTLEIKRPEDNFLMVNLTLGAGYDFKVTQNKPFKIFVKAGLYPFYYHLFPFNDQFRGEIGVITSLSAFKKKK